MTLLTLGRPRVRRARLQDSPQPRLPRRTAAGALPRTPTLTLTLTPTLTLTLTLTLTRSSSATFRRRGRMRPTLSRCPRAAADGSLRATLYTFFGSSGIPRKLGGGRVYCDVCILLRHIVSLIAIRPGPATWVPEGASALCTTLRRRSRRTAACGRRRGRRGGVGCRDGARLCTHRSRHTDPRARLGPGRRR